MHDVSDVGRTREVMALDEETRERLRAMLEAQQQVQDDHGSGSDEVLDGGDDDDGKSRGRGVGRALLVLGLLVVCAIAFCVTFFVVIPRVMGPADVPQTTQGSAGSDDSSGSARRTDTSARNDGRAGYEAQEAGDTVSATLTFSDMNVTVKRGEADGDPVTIHLEGMVTSPVDAEIRGQEMPVLNYGGRPCAGDGRFVVEGGSVTRGDGAKSVTYDAEVTPMVGSKFSFEPYRGVRRDASGDRNDFLDVSAEGLEEVLARLDDELSVITGEAKEPDAGANAVTMEEATSTSDGASS